MGNSVEGRFPFLDVHVAELAGSLPASVKLPHLKEKDLLRLAVADLLPPAITRRPKMPYRAPDLAAFAGATGRGLVAEHLDPQALAAVGWWQPQRVASLRRKWEAGRLTSARETMGFVGVVTAQMLARQFGGDYHARIAATCLAADELVWRNLAPCEERHGPA
jgi:asparagine synthase (glutamine-hydrolysing)